MSDDLVDWAHLAALAAVAPRLYYGETPVADVLAYPFESHERTVARIASALRSAYAAGQREAQCTEPEVWAVEYENGERAFFTEEVYAEDAITDESHYGREATLLRYVIAPEVTP
jgi:hypothetical protein